MEKRNVIMPFRFSVFFEADMPKSLYRPCEKRELRGVQNDCRLYHRLTDVAALLYQCDVGVMCGLSFAFTGTMSAFSIVMCVLQYK